MGQIGNLWAKSIFGVDNREGSFINWPLFKYNLKLVALLIIYQVHAMQVTLYPEECYIVKSVLPEMPCQLAFSFHCILTNPF